ncbi:hypothetical protein MNB_SM-5-602 [hydrothermal vent metagenome]|uniref:Uncharacterized protein n=1 Tax=hydrothermal vent metagenome TaxID=652676 RepID=A0A1W1CLS7_9ZZZZ
MKYLQTTGVYIDTPTLFLQTLFLWGWLFFGKYTYFFKFRDGSLEP